VEEEDCRKELEARWIPVKGRQ
jgi:hypothetical protein